MLEMISSEALTALFQVVMIDLVLAGDNAIVIGLAAAGLPDEQRRKAIVVGILAATALRIGFASVTVQLLQIIGLLLAGGVLLLWVCWKMWRELRHQAHKPMILVFGLALSIALMGFAANFIARILEKHRWVAYVGLLIILYVALDMCYRGGLEVWQNAKV